MEEFAQFARRLIDLSAGTIMQNFRKLESVDHKTDGSLVTIADRQAEAIMREAITKTYPAHGIIGEEFGDFQPDAEFQWTLDPIDGTINFVHGTPFFGTLIGLMQNGDPMLGVLNLPVLNQFLIGYNGETRLNGQPVHMRPCERIEDATLVSSAHWDVEQYRNMNAYEQLTKRAKLYRTWGDCYGYYMIATGYADIMIDSYLHFWDFVPLISIIQGAGGVITDWYGGDIMQTTGEKGCVAAGKSLHQLTVQALA